MHVFCTIAQEGRHIEGWRLGRLFSTADRPVKVEFDACSRVERSCYRVARFVVVAASLGGVLSCIESIMKKEKVEERTAYDQ